MSALAITSRIRLRERSRFTSSPPSGRDEVAVAAAEVRDAPGSVFLAELGDCPPPALRVVLGRGFVSLGVRSTEAASEARVRPRHEPLHGFVRGRLFAAAPEGEVLMKVEDRISRITVHRR